MSKFNHIRTAVAASTPEYDETATWRPPNWFGSIPCPGLIVQRPYEGNVRFVRASLNRRIPEVPNRPSGEVKVKDIELRRRRNILVLVIGLVVDWDVMVPAEVKDGTTPASSFEKLPFPGITDSANPGDTGVAEVLDLLDSLGIAAQLDFIMFCNQQVNWEKQTVDDDGDEDPGAVIPLRKP